MTLLDLMGAPPKREMSAKEAAADGMARAVEHANQVEPEWSDKAGALLRQYAERHSEFMTEDVRVWAHENGLEYPPDPRAWGAVANRAVRAALIQRIGFRPTKIRPAHATPRPVWRSLVYVA